jgi:hypothetical protein
LVGNSADGPVVFYRGRRYRLEARALEVLEPAQRVGPRLFRQHLLEAARGARAGDLVLFGAFAEAGTVAFDFEFGSHGGVGPEELDQFVLYPSHVELPLTGAVTAEEFHRFFRAHYFYDDAAGRAA